MRTSFITELIENSKINDKIFLLVGDLGFNVVEPYVELFPDRFLNVGIAEQNMAGIAAGLALEGFCVYIYSIGNFPTLRCMEQIRYDICYHNLNVKIVAVGGGYSYGSLGASHHATEEIGMLRTIPNLVVCAPGDPVETKIVTKFCSEYNGPCYIRIGKAGEANVHLPEKANNISSIEILNVKEGSDIAVFTTGSTLKYTYDFVLNNNLNCSIYSFPIIKPFSKEQILPIFKKYIKIITIEEHQSNCGFGSSILEVLNDLDEEGLIKQKPSIKRIAIKDKFSSVAGSQEYLRKASGIELLIKDFKI
jgi:transketolase